MKLLFVCSGNICRSPTAEGVMRQLVLRDELQDRIVVDSAGMQSYHIGESPDPRSAALAATRGFPLDGQVARQVMTEDFETFDLLLGLDKGHVRQLERLAPPGVRDKVVLFLEHAGVGRGREVPDPYYGSARDFELAFDLVLEGCEKLLAKVRAD